ncbi:MAG: Uma2 family endonuclease, partial [Ignavibacteriae bacterium]|nr:Uma2 family endonuclease [Ignavibacteriota bacterium]
CMPQIADELKVTYRDILSLGESNQRIELFDGECIMTAMPTIQHQLIATKLAMVLSRYIEKKQAGIVLGAPVDVVLSDVIVFQPDVCYLSHERSSINDGKKFNASPDLVVEILSEGTEERDRTFKFREYARGGAKEYWLVSPEKKEIEVYQTSPKGFQLVKVFKHKESMNTPLFPDAEFSLKEIFP